MGLKILQSLRKMDLTQNSLTFHAYLRECHKTSRIEGVSKPGTTLISLSASFNIITIHTTEAQVMILGGFQKTHEEEFVLLCYERI